MERVNWLRPTGSINGSFWAIVAMLLLPIGVGLEFEYFERRKNFIDGFLAGAAIVYVIVALFAVVWIWDWLTVRRYRYEEQIRQETLHLSDADRIYRRKI